MLISRAKDAIERLSLLQTGFIVIFTHAQFMRAMQILRLNNGKEVQSLMNRFRELPRFENCEVMKWQE